MRSLVAINRIIFSLGAVQRQQAAATAGGHAARRDQHKILGNWLMSVHGRVLVTVIRRRG